NNIPRHLQSPQTKNQNTINNIERLREDIRAGRQQIRDTIRNLFRAQNDELNRLNQNIRNLNDNQNTIMNRQSETITRIETLRQRHMDRIEEIPERINNMQNLVIHSRGGRELENTIIEPSSSSNIEFVTQSTTGKRIHEDSTKKEISCRKGRKISCSDQEFAIFKDVEYTTNPQRSLEATEPQQISVRYERPITPHLSIEKQIEITYNRDNEETTDNNNERNNRRFISEFQNNFKNIFKRQ
ncbi:10192_t:CDS:2, partial [Gigaspora margarita]